MKPEEKAEVYNIARDAYEKIRIGKSNMPDSNDPEGKMNIDLISQSLVYDVVRKYNKPKSSSKALASFFIVMWIIFGLAPFILTVIGYIHGQINAQPGQQMPLIFVLVMTLFPLAVGSVFLAIYSKDSNRSVSHRDVCKTS